jgi:hypothetical protein
MRSESKCPCLGSEESGKPLNFGDLGGKGGFEKGGGEEEEVFGVFGLGRVGETPSLLEGDVGTMEERFGD